jgi:diketogulonate reductase-like aldo/keto reductase
MHFQSRPDDVQTVAQDAIDAGYRHLDCAFVYRNESEVGEGMKLKIQEGVIQRGNLFIASKVSLCRPDNCTLFYGCETWFVTLREEHRVRVFENRVLRGIFGPKRDEVKG